MQDPFNIPVFRRNESAERIRSLFTLKPVKNQKCNDKNARGKSVPSDEEEAGTMFLEAIPLSDPAVIRGIEGGPGIEG